MFESGEVSVSELEPRKAPEPMPYIEPPCKPKVPDVSLLINNAPVGNYDKVGSARRSEESYNAWKWRQNNAVENQDKRHMHHSLKQPADSPPCNTIRDCYSDPYVQKSKLLAGKEQDLRYRTLTENWHLSNFSPGTQLYTPIGESTPLQGILRNTGRNAVMYDHMNKIPHRVSYQPSQEPYVGGKPLTEVNTYCKPSSSPTRTSHRSYTSSNHNMRSNQENIIPQSNFSHRVPMPHHTNQLQTLEYNCCPNQGLENNIDQEVNQRNWELKEKQYTAHGGLRRNQTMPCSCCGSQNFRNAPSGDTNMNHLNGCGNEKDPKCNTASPNMTKPQSCCDNASRNFRVNNATDTEVHEDSKIPGSNPLQSSRVKEASEPQPEILAALFRLVCMQNEQLQHLKEQVQKLVEKLEASTQPAKVCTQNVAVQSENVCSCYQEKVSIGVMVALGQEQVRAKRSEQEQPLVPVANRSCHCCQKPSPAVDETINFSSMKLQTLHEPPPSPTSTVHVDMHDYQSVEEHGEPSVGKDEHRKEQQQRQQQAEDGERIHWTFYSNVMQQMNKLMDGTDKHPANNTAEDSQKKIQMATFKELVHMGVSICDAAAAVGDQSLLFDSRLNMMALNTERTDSDPKPKISPEALKYLDEQLRQTDKNDAGNKVDMTLFLKTSNLSFTAMRYLQQNHGLPLFTDPSKGPQVQRSPAVHESSPHHHQCCYSHDAPPSKVLDITMLKQQPKLL